MPASAHRDLEANLDWKPLLTTLQSLRLSASYLLDRQVYQTYTEVLSAGNQTASFHRATHAISGVVPNTLHVRIAYDLSSRKPTGLGGYPETDFRDNYDLDNTNLLKAPSSALVNLNLHYELSENQGKPSHVRVYFGIQNLANHTYVGTASNITDSINATTGAENGPGTLEGATGSIYAGTPRASFGDVRFKF